MQDEELSYRQKCIFGLSALCLEFHTYPLQYLPIKRVHRNYTVNPLE